MFVRGGKNNKIVVTCQNHQMGSNSRSSDLPITRYFKASCQKRQAGCATVDSMQETQDFSFGARSLI
jgi:hypothetical protein